MSTTQRSRKSVCLVAGPNGSGKSTFIGELLRQQNGIPDFLVSIDDLVQTPKYSHIRDLKDRYIKVMKDVENYRKELLLKGASFSFETVFSHDSKVEFIKEAHAHGYYITMIFIGTVDPNINLERVAKRVSEGGHDVPPDKVISRWYRSYVNLLKALPFIHTLYIFDNSENTPVEVAYKDNTYVRKNLQFEVFDCYRPILEVLGKSR